MKKYFVQQTKEFYKWHKSLKDIKAKVAVARRIDRIMQGNLGDFKSVGKGVSELRFNLGSGYRVYFTLRENILIVLLAGGDKSSQIKDIVKAQQLAKEIK